MTDKASSLPRDVPLHRRTVLLAFDEDLESLNRGIVDYARQHGWHLLNIQYYDMELPRSFSPDGILFQLPESRMPLLRQLLRMDVPKVQIEDLAGGLDCPSVVQVGRERGRVAAEHFISRGFKNLAYLRSEAWDRPQAQWPCESFLAHARQMGARADVISVQNLKNTLKWSQFDALVARFRDEISRIELPLGIFTYHDVMGVRICHFCEAIGLRVPEQVAVLGAGNNQLKCDCSSVPLSSVDPDSFGQGRAASELLDKLMDGQPASNDTIMIPPKAVAVRQSTDVLAMPDVDSARALRYIWAHCFQHLTVRDVAEAISISRRKLERCFRAHLGRSVNDEFTRKRIERCCELLATTRKPISVIADEVGFRTGPYLFRLFHKVIGTTPRRYRLANSPQAPVKAPRKRRDATATPEPTADLPDTVDTADPETSTAQSAPEPPTSPCE